MTTRLALFLIDFAGRLGVPLAAALLLGGCSTLDYYGHLARGHLQLLQAREPITELLADPGTDAGLKQRRGQWNPEAAGEVDKETSKASGHARQISALLLLPALGSVAVSFAARDERQQPLTGVS